ncbi:MAG: MBL fold metallo-hydrolase [Gemmatimonadota bacterium]
MPVQQGIDTAAGPNRVDVVREPVSAAREIAPDLAYLRTSLANVYLWGRPGARDRQWVLIDTGMPGSASRIRAAAAARFGPGARPLCIILTHGHFDHVGTVRELAQGWDVLVYAHALELPYLTGRSCYAPPDPTVGGGAMAMFSFLYPKRPIDLRGHVTALPPDGTVPGMPGWRWIHTPGHTHGHVSLFHDDDGSLIAGDAVTTVKQESMLAVLSQRPTMHGPPAYFTADWDAAGESVRHLASLRPELLATGHGVPLRGDSMRRSLDMLAHNFDRVAVPDNGRYVHYPAIADARGVVMLPRRPFRASTAVWIVGGLLVGGALLWSRTRSYDD